MASKLTTITTSTSSASKKRKARDSLVKDAQRVLLQNRPRTRAASKARACSAARNDVPKVENGAPSTSTCSDKSETSDHEKAHKLFPRDTTNVTVYAFIDRLGEVLHNMCVNNEKMKSYGGDEGSLEALTMSECGEDDLAVLVHNLLTWDDTSRCVGIVALVLLDRIQTSERGFAITFNNVCKLFAICFLLAKKYLDDCEV